MKAQKLTYEELVEKLSDYAQYLNDTQTLSLIGSWSWNVSLDKTDWTDMMFILLGYQPHEVSPTYELAFNHVHSDDKDKYQQTLSEAVAQKKPFYLENRLVKKDGSIISVISRGMCLTNEEGELTRMIGTVQDITEFKEKEKILEHQKEIVKNYSIDLEQKVKSRTEKLAESESKLLQAHHVAKLGTWEWNVQTDDIELSDQVYENFGLVKGSLVKGAEFLNFVHPEDLEYVRIKIEESREEESPISIKYRIITPKGETRFMLTMGKPILDERGEFIKMIGTVQEITPLEKVAFFQSQVDAILQGQEMERERIAADLHDSIKPLVSIASLNLELLLDSSKNDQDLKIEKLESSIAILKNVIVGVEEISRNLSPAILKNFGLEKALEQLCNGVIETEKLQVDFSAFGLKKRVDAKVEVALYRIGQELLNNIRKHANATRLDFQIIRHDESLVMMVADNGEGFDPSLQEKETRGFGIKNINYRVQSLNGYINIDSSIGNGTTVTVEIPL